MKTTWLQEYELHTDYVPGESSFKASGAPATLEVPPIPAETSANTREKKPSGALPTQVGDRKPSSYDSDLRGAPDGTPLGPEVKSMSKGKDKGKSIADEMTSFPWGVEDWSGHAAS